MGQRDTLVTEIGAAVGIVGLLLVFLPLFLDRVTKSTGASMRVLRLRTFQAWLIPATSVVAATATTSGLVTLWCKADLAQLTAVLVLVATWLVVGLAILAVATVW
jgi:hypothetical protein